MSFLGQRGPGPLCASGLLAIKVRASGETLVPEWFGSLVFGGAVVACGAGVYACGAFRKLLFGGGVSPAVVLQRNRGGVCD